MAAILLLLIMVAFWILGPLLTIWALNTLFGLAIVYTFWTWLAALILMGVVKAQTSTTQKSS